MLHFKLLGIVTAPFSKLCRKFELQQLRNLKKEDDIDNSVLNFFHSVSLNKVVAAPSSILNNLNRRHENSGW